MSDYSFINYEVEDQTAFITINREEVYNALNADAKYEIVKAVRAANKDTEVRSIILTAKGKAFCTGQDLNDRSVQAGEKPVDLGNTLETEWNPLVQSIRDSKKIIIGAINGVSAGAGLSVALACDYIIAAPGVKFISGFSKLGLAPDAGSSFTFTRALGSKRTLDFFLFNEPLTSEELASSGLINSVSSELIESAKEVSKKINAMAPHCVELIKKNIQFAAESTFKESINNEIYAQRFLGNSEDYKEGLSAFFEKRAPNFKGN
ncbi:enoyl-CoA hydratase-related protein [Halobacteriovorax sp. JY17]|uniref:enoyl-CoA hydratase-related protein n=1 Tax=Halobacteriovorax sp. JY17 TaxID=2014617 RepID=UPI000C40FCAC|nr:enoyl-CoA hydratase-related protein [Halobacteriovorax sp. JY17]PIK15940.1 MAG: 2-(1,2-epoxy-1,2-dihydrophenyl)acetyl-CoA isomerase [Halobacteriovorax sp. JY17]